MQTGLTSQEADTRRLCHGPNKLPEKPRDGVLTIFLRQFHSPFVYMLFAATLVSFGLGQTLNAVFILAVLLINAIIGTVQEYSAQQAAAALQKIVPQHAAVIRDGVTQTIDAIELVPGDLVLLASGDKVPADLQLVESRELLIDESILTGESQAASKRWDAEVSPHASLTEQDNRAFAGTIVTHGRARGEVIATGTHSQIGTIAQQVTVSEPIKPPLLQRIQRFTLRISYAVLLVIALLFTLTLLRGDDLSTVFLLGVALAVSAIPEGLPAAITVALAIGMRRMAKVNVIVRKLVAVESLGSCTYIASDKTGTLTVNEMTVKKINLPDGGYCDISGEGIDIHGEITACHDMDPESDTLRQLVLTGLLANEASLTGKTGNSGWMASGDGVDLAFLVLAAKYGFDLQQAKQRYPLVKQIPYESENAFSASINRVDAKQRIFVKGSTEKVLAMCHSSAAGALDKAAVTQQMEQLAEQGYRVLALASGELDDAADLPENLTGLTFLGLAGMIDPLRPEAKQAVAECRNANIDVAMITGDHPRTALAIAQELGFADGEAVAVSGKQLNEALQQGGSSLAELVSTTRVFARVEPNQKLQIVRQLIANGHYVAVTGDGVNDAPALRNAHVGIAMGNKGTDVARESSDLILTDDNFASIVQGIKQGRIVYNNIRKVIFLLISTGAAEITLFILSVLFGLPIPLFPIQLLWLNLVTNGIQDVALAFEPAEGNELKKPPRPPGEAIFNRLMIERVAINAAVMGSLAFAVFFWCISQGFSEYESRNLTLLLMVLFENVHVLNSRSESLSITRQPFFGNPFLLFGMLAAQAIHIAALYAPGLSEILQVSPVTFEEWRNLLLIALLLIVVDETHKFWHWRFGRHAPNKPRLVSKHMPL